MARIELTDVHLSFSAGTDRLTVKDRVLGRMMGRKLAPPAQIHALNGVTFRIDEGERLGIVGHNGAGKSTMLRMLTGVYQPTQGLLQVKGKLDSLLDLQVGIEPEATGWDNIAFRGYLRGDTPAEVRAKRPAIAAFSELGEHLHRPVRHYSSGMMLRLLFSLATAIDPEILLVDEVLSAGDIGFYEKAKRRMLDLIEKARILVIVSHDLGSLEAICSRVIWMNQGRVAADGSPHRIIEEYKRFMLGESKRAAA